MKRRGERYESGHGDYRLEGLLILLATSALSVYVLFKIGERIIQ